jgi:hypothetical protein
MQDDARLKLDQSCAKRVAAELLVPLHAKLFKPLYLQKSLNGVALNCV